MIQSAIHWKDCLLQVDYSKNYGQLFCKALIDKQKKPRNHKVFSFVVIFIPKSLYKEVESGLNSIKLPCSILKEVVLDAYSAF